MRFGVLGPLAVWGADGTAIRIPELKVRALLADLLVQEGRPVSVDRLAEDLWHGRPPGNPVNTLQTKVSQLRRALEEAEPGGRDLVVYQPPGYFLRAGHDAVDAQRFRDLVTLADETDDPRCWSRRWDCGAARRWPTSPTRNSPGPPSSGWRSSG
jgi:DNA-binding SARP family transcriptional activator